jgi:hypothetical protein
MSGYSPTYHRNLPDRSKQPGRLQQPNEYQQSNSPQQPDRSEQPSPLDRSQEPSSLSDVPSSQTAPVKWSSLSRMHVSSTLDVLGRLSSTGVDIYTVEIVKGFGNSLTLPDDHLEKVKRMLIDPKLPPKTSDTLSFGTGISVIPQMLAETVGGIAFATIIGALRVSFSAQYTARVLSEILQNICPLSDIDLPSLSQLEKLSDEVASSYVDKDLAGEMWNIDAGFIMYELKHTTAPPSADEMAKIIHTFVVPEDSPQHITVYSPSASPQWIAAFASNIMGYKVGIMHPNFIVWQSDWGTPIGQRPDGYSTLQLYTSDQSPTNPPDNSEGTSHVGNPSQTEINDDLRISTPDTYEEHASIRIPLSAIIEWLLLPINALQTTDITIDKIRKLLLEYVGFYFHHRLMYGELLWQNSQYRTVRNPMIPYLILHARKAFMSIAPNFARVAETEFHDFDFDHICTSDSECCESVADFMKDEIQERPSDFIQNDLELLPTMVPLEQLQSIAEKLISLCTLLFFLEYNEEFPLEFDGFYIHHWLQGTPQTPWTRSKRPSSVSRFYKLDYTAVRGLLYMMATGNKEVPRTADTIPMASSGQGYFLVSHMIIHPDTHFYDKLRYYIGQGSIFVNKRIVSGLVSLPSNVSDGCCLPGSFIEYSACAERSTHTLGPGSNPDAEKELSFSITVYTDDQSPKKGIAFKAFDEDAGLLMFLSPLELLEAEFMCRRFSWIDDAASSSSGIVIPEEISMCNVALLLSYLYTDTGSDANEVLREDAPCVVNCRGCPTLRLLALHCVYHSGLTNFIKIDKAENMARGFDYIRHGGILILP